MIGGGAISSWQGSFTDKGSIYFGNKAFDDHGGACDLKSGDVIITSSSYFHNNAKDGAAISIGEANLVTLSHCVISHNVASASGAFYINQGAHVVITNITSRFNTARKGILLINNNIIVKLLILDLGPGMFFKTSGTVAVTSSTFQNNTSGTLLVFLILWFLNHNRG